MSANYKINEITVGLGERSYTIAVASGLLDQIGNYAQTAKFASPLAIIADDTVAAVYGERVKTSLEQAGFTTALLTFPAGESSKTLMTVSGLYDQLVKLKPERNSGIIALGGGVTGDMAGFAAATYLRGIRFIQVPTTLLAQVDSSVGGKVGVDHPGGKNLIGAFHQPSLVLIDPSTLSTLDSRQLRAGLAEIIKHGVIQDEALFARIEKDLPLLLKGDLDSYQEIVPWNCRIKARVVEQDERETGLRAILNFGHTIGHAIESLTGYETYLHGEAVAMGMLIEAQLGQKLGITPAEIVNSLKTLLQNAGYPLTKPALTGDDMLNSMFRDKKVQDKKIRFVFPARIGATVIQAVDDIQIIKEVWNQYSL